MDENMKMDNEFFRSEVTDEWNTPAAPDAETPPSAPVQGEGRKKRTRNAAHLVMPVAAAALAAVVIASRFAHCPICGQKDCRYYYNSGLGQDSIRAVSQRILDEDLPDLEPGQPTGENRMGYQDFAVSGTEDPDMRNTTCLSLEDGPIVLLHDGSGLIHEKIAGSYRVSNVYEPYAQETDAGLCPQRVGYGGLSYQSLEDTGEPLFYVEVLYLPSGEVPDAEDYAYYNNHQLPLDSYQFSKVQPLEGFEGLWVRAYSNHPLLSPEDLIEIVDISLQPALGQTISLGGTMMLDYDVSDIMLLETEVDGVRNAESTGIKDVPREYTNSFSFEEDFPFSKYYFLYFDSSNVLYSSSNCSIAFSKKDYHDVIQRYNFLYDAASAGGHYPLFHFIQLASETVNGITYDVFLRESTMDFGKTFYTGPLWVIPQQEPTCLIQMPVSFACLQTTALQENVAPGTSLSAVGDVDDWRQLLSNISLNENA